MAKKVNLVKKKRKFWLSRDDMQLSLLALPTTVWYILFAFLPMFGIIIAFKNYKVTPRAGFFTSLLNSEWSGLANFEFLFTSGTATIMIRNTILYNLAFIVLGVVVPVTLAILMSQLYSKRAAKVFQTAMFLPHFMSWVVVTYFVTAFLSTDKGVLNSILELLGKEDIQWYREPKYWPYFIIFLNLWKSMGYGMVVYLATITGIDDTFYEAAVIDGASKWQQAKYITLPMLKVVMIMMFILATGRIFYSDFGLFYQVPKASGALFEVTETIDVFIYKALKGSTNVSMASAAAFLQSVLGCLTILGTNWIVKRIDKDSAII